MPGLQACLLYTSTPLVGQGYTWFTIDVLGFDEAFQGTLNQIGALLALLGTWVFSDAITGDVYKRQWIALICAPISAVALAV